MFYSQKKFGTKCCKNDCFTFRIVSMTETASTDVDNFQIPANLTGYDEFDTFVAQQSTQGGRTHYSIVVPVQRVLSILPTPDPNQPFEDNRQVNRPHAAKFGEYIRTQPNWHSGPLTARTTAGVVEFDPFPWDKDGSIHFGMLRIPRNRVDDFRIIDGQHRVYGIAILKQSLADEKFERSNRLAKAEASGQKDQVPQLKKDLQAIVEIESRMKREAISIDLLIENDQSKARQIFVDVADNARGIPKPVRARFDMSKVVNRAMAEVLGNPPLLLVGRVDDQKDLIRGANPNFIGAGTLSEIIRLLTVGSGKIGKAMEQSLDSTKLARDGSAFFDLLTTTFPELNALANGTKSAQEVRASSLLGSATMLRILAGVYHDVVQTHGKAAAAGLLQKLANHTQAPINGSTQSGKLWLNCGTEETFIDGAHAPGARSQQLKDATKAIASWASSPPKEL